MIDESTLERDREVAEIGAWLDQIEQAKKEARIGSRLYTCDMDGKITCYEARGNQESGKIEAWVVTGRYTLTPFSIACLPEIEETGVYLQR